MIVPLSDSAFTSVSGENDDIVNVLGLVVELLIEADLSVAGSDLEGVDIVLEGVADDRVAAAIHVFGFQLKFSCDGFLYTEHH